MGKKEQLLSAQKEFRELADKQEKIYQDLLVTLGETDEPHYWIWDFIANDEPEVASQALLNFLARIEKV